MALNKVRIGDHIELVKIKCGIPNLTVDDISGINREKEFFEPSKQVGSDTSKYKIVPPGCFACNLMHVGRDIVLPIAINRTEKNKIVSPAYTVFKFKSENKILKEYFFIFLNSHEKDRFFWFHCDSSIRDGMEWDTFCNLIIEIPEIEIQQKFVSIYQGLLQNKKVFETKIDDIRIAYEGILEKYLKQYPLEEIGKYIVLNQEQNTSLKYKLVDVMGVSAEKRIIPTKADASRNDLSKFTVVYPNDFVYNPRNGVAVAVNDLHRKFIISWNNTCFRLTEEGKKLFSEKYIHMFMCRKEWDRHTKFLSWGSSTEVFSFKAMGQTCIPVATREEQDALVALFEEQKKRQEYSQTIKKMIYSICPILVRGSLLEAERE